MSTIMDDNQQLGHYISKFEAFRHSDREREDMVANLLREHQALRHEYQKKCNDYESERDGRRMYQEELKRARTEVETARKSKESNPFVFAVIDGDGAIFLDDFLSGGKDGGAEAAHQLYTKLHHCIMDSYPDQNTQDWNIVVQVILNLDGLAKKLQSCGVVKNPNEVYAFARAFGRTQPLFTFIDVGSGKEQADHKVRETFRWMARLSQCKHIFFGPCHDNGYLPFLEEYKRNPAVAPRLTLIESTPALPGFVQLGFKTAKFPQVFRDTLLETPITAAMRSMSIPTPSAAAKGSPPNGGASLATSYATIGSAANATKPGTITVERKKPAPRKFYLVNAHNERLDQDLPRYDPNAEKRYMDRVKKQGRNCCNRYHLRNECENGDYCAYEHGEGMSQGELLVLRHKSRGIKCSMTYLCEDADCPLSHHCRFGKSCTLDNCRFADTHHVDLRPAARIYEDGTRSAILT